MEKEKNQHQENFISTMVQQKQQQMTMKNQQQKQKQAFFAFMEKNLSLFSEI